MAESTAAAKAKAEAPPAASSAAAVEKPSASARNVLTDDMPQPPSRRRSRRTERKRRTGPFVKYVGQASHRTISPTDWRSLGFTPKESGDKNNPGTFNTDTWSPKNDFIIESANFTDEQLDYLLLDDIQAGSGAHSFLEVDYNEDGRLDQVVDDEDDAE